MGRYRIGCAVLAIACLLMAATGCAKQPTLSSRLIVTVDAPMLEQGGAVIVSARPIADREWRLLEGARSTKAGYEKEFQVTVASPASIIELHYPESGTYSFKLQPAARAKTHQLQSRRVLIGQADLTDPQTKRQVHWPSMSVVHVSGSTYPEGWARILASTFDVPFKSDAPDNYVISSFPAGRVIALTPKAIDTYVRDTN
ncbi:Secreted protein [Xanthomonas phaseoli pv. phaseoli]|uniref:Secreted protein n=2 Tax=Xanthomonas campestris pv. phaseoli TaxID=317013 RepID=A0AB38E2E9_XANCH|nr:Secreted protein [Xanthomonas phaseoli pv. phaseoli]SON87579.1 Secreted protein [Xanthomonas phaseoli pv. phaseoli]SON91361.1 Secreted protein [Xanthomonas phaseoli pv. phaseoli]SOO28591.1 Secreted protein [Xanthomonas phaseoli pv. phaseoli]